MAEADLNKSLDDLIAEQRQKTKPKRAEPRKGDRAERGRGGSGAARQRPVAGGQRRERPDTNLSITVRGGGVAKARGQGRGARPARDHEADRQNAEQRRAALEGDAKWSHDRFEGGRGRAGGAGQGRRDPRAPTRLGTKIPRLWPLDEATPHIFQPALWRGGRLRDRKSDAPDGCRFISNLAYEVSEDDIKELFETCGQLVKHQVHFDRSGRSEGSAEVIFANKIDAERAMKRYNNVQLDGQPMQLELIEAATANDGGGAGGRVLSSGLRVTGGGSGGLTVTRSFAQATSGIAAEARQPRGRGSIRSRVDYMQE
ncbi:hypothetical protein N2152v2_005675 [Parachlorella kessleri]